MKKTLFFLVALLFYEQVLAQIHEPTSEEIARKKRFEEIKQEFINANYQEVLNYYDSILSRERYTTVEAYKMANLRYLELSKSAQDSLSMRAKADSAYHEAVKWHGKVLVNERWDTLKIRVLEEPEIFKIVDQQPQFPGGMAALYQYIAREIEYPIEARRKGIEGKVFVQFIINKDGSIDAVNVVKDIGGGCGEEAERIIRNAPNFIPGMQEGKPVYVRMILPVTFKLSANPPKKKKKRN